jgi:hypothetical protein
MAKGNSCSILIAGDFFLESHISAISFSEDEIFSDYLSVIQSSDLAIVNFEGPIDKGTNQIKKVGPNIRAATESVSFLKKAGFDLLTLATNHIMDLGKEGLVATLSECRSCSLNHVGAGENLVKARKSAFYNISNYKISIINIAENEFCSATNEKAGANPLNLISNFYDLMEAKKESDFVFVIVHGGHEGYSLPSPRMKETFRFFVDVGADAVVCHHTHCISGYEIYKNKPIFYGLGNFVFEWYGNRQKDWYLGYSTQLLINDGILDFRVIPHMQHIDRLGIRLLTPAENVAFENEISSLNSTINNDSTLIEHFEEFCKKSFKTYTSYIEPHSFRYLSALQSRGVVPSFWSKRKKLYLLNMIRCESHRDIIQNLLEDEAGNT